MSLMNRRYKDSVFTDLFGSDKDGKKNFLDLYNALSGNNYSLNEVSLERKVIEQSLYKTFNNDVSWEINGQLIVLVEHQSTVNQNMPFRCLEYVTRIYEEIVPVTKRYAEKIYRIPNPEFFVIYIGKEKLPEEQELRLSDAFYKRDGNNLELVVKVKNCTDSKKLPIIRNCDILKQYCQFIEIVEARYNKLHPKSSFKKAIEQAISQGILSDYLDRKSREVINMLCAKYDYKMDIAVKQEEAFEDGLIEGAKKNAFENAKNALAMNLTAEQVSKITSLPLDEVLKIKKDFM